MFPTLDLVNRKNKRNFRKTHGSSLGNFTYTKMKLDGKVKKVTRYLKLIREDEGEESENEGCLEPQDGQQTSAGNESFVSFGRECEDSFVQESIFSSTEDI